MQHTYSAWLTHWLPRPLAALGLLLATAGAAQAQTPTTFAPAVTYSTGTTPQGIALVDINGDGRLDIITANSNSNNVGVLFGSATTPGTFPATATFYGSGGGFPVGIGVGDVNGDGRPDIVVSSSANVGVLLNQATAPGTFSAAIVYSSGNSSPRGLALTDVNRDGRLDIVTGGNGNLGVLLNLAAAPGTFGPAATYNTGTAANDIAVGDVNGDGRPDVAVSNFNGGNISLLLNSASAPGTFPAVASYNTGGISARGITLGDVNGDGQLDLVTGNQDSNNISVLLNQAASPGTFGPAVLYSSGANGPNGVAVRDMNGDGRLDIVSANNNAGSGSTVSVLLNSATTPGTFLAGTTYNSGGSGPIQIALGDVNGDSQPDITTTLVNSAAIGVLLNTTPAAAAPVVTAPTNNSITNGQPTFAGTAPAGSTVTLYSALGGGPAQVLGTTTATGGSFSFIPATTLASGTYSVYVTAQSSGQAVSRQSNTVAFTVDATPPTATINTTSGSPTSTAPFPFTVAFSEAVTGLSASSFTVANGTVTSGPTSSGANAYSFSVTPTGNGVVSVSLPANAVRDAVGNGNPISNTVSVQYTAPITATTWTGTTSTDWFTAGNWTQGVPDATIDAIIPTAPSGGRFPAVAAGTASTRNLTFNSAATLNQSGGTIAIAASLTNNGTFLPTGGTVSLGSTTLSNVLGSSNIRFWNLTVGANGAQLSTSIGAAVQRLLTLNGNFSTNGNAFVLESNTTLTALVVNNSSNVVNGTVTVQRAIDPSVNPGLGYRHYAAPVSNSMVGDLATKGFTPVVNPAFNTAASPNAVVPFPTVFGYDDSRLSLTNNLDMFDKGYFSPSALSDPLAVGKGYTINIAASEVVDFQGTLNNGNLSLNLTSTRNTYPDGGWQLLGNPYPAPLDYSRVAATDRIGLESAIFVYSSTSQYGGRYRAYVNGIGNPIIPLGQGFFARVASGQTVGSFTFRNSQRLTAPDNTPFQRTAADPRPLVQLTLKAAGSPDVADEFFAYAQPDATASFDDQLDAAKLPNPTGFNLAGVAATGEPLAVDARAIFTATTVLPLTVGVPAAGAYSLNATALDNLPAGLTAYLRDAQTGQTTKLTAGTSYNFHMSAAEAQALVMGRFTVVFSPQTALATTPSLSVEAVSVYPNPAHSSFAVTMPGVMGANAVQAELVNTLGQVVRRQSAGLPASGTSFNVSTTELATGVYMLRLQAGSTTLTKRVVVQ